MKPVIDESTTPQLVPDWKEIFSANLTRWARHCAVCGNGDWIMLDKLICSNVLRADLSMDSGNVVAFVEVTCSRCNQSLFFNAKRLGLIR